MSKEKETKIKKERKIINKFIFLFLAIALTLSGFAIFELCLLNSIEDLLRYMAIAVICCFDLFFIIKYLGLNKKKKKRKKGLFLLILIFYSIICFFIGGIIHYIYGQVSNINKINVVYKSDLLVMSSSPCKDVKDVKNMKLAILSDKKSPEGYIIPQEIIDKNKLQDDNEIVEYDDYTTMLVDLYSDEIDGMFVSDNYVTMFSGITGYENIETDTKVIISKEKEMKKADTSSIETASAGKSITEPFTILLMGIDSTDEVLEKNAIANGDTLILITFNPKTLNATMLSIPRDSYVPISCWSGKPENKITHAAAYGNDCMINTIENYFKVNIDYYAKINFKGLVKLVDAVGGVEVDVPQRLCTDDSNRYGELCIEEGHQTLNGEQALVFARNRKALANGDFGRAEHQQEIIMALINKMKNIKDVSTFMDLLNTISNSIDTNLTTKQILSFYNIGKDIIKKSLSSDEADLVNIQRLYLQGFGQMIYDERARMVLWDYVPNENSRKDIVNAMYENLEKAEHVDITEFSFSINSPYEKPIIGEGPYKTGNGYNLLPDFTGDTESTARATCTRIGISCSFEGTGGTVVNQSEPARKRIDLMKGKNLRLTLSISKKDDKVKEKDDSKDTDKDKNNDDDEDDKQNPSKDVNTDSPSPTTDPSPSENEQDNNDK